MELVFTRAELPLTLKANAEGEIFHLDGESPLDDASISAALREHYHLDAKPNLHAVAIQMPPEAPRNGLGHP